MDYQWPYKNETGCEERISCDVLVLGGGMAGCYAAIAAARRGCAVVLMEKLAGGRNLEKPAENRNAAKPAGSGNNRNSSRGMLVLRRLCDGVPEARRHPAAAPVDEPRQIHPGGQMEGFVIPC